MPTARLGPLRPTPFPPLPLSPRVCSARCTLFPSLVKLRMLPAAALLPSHRPLPWPLSPPALNPPPPRYSQSHGGHRRQLSAPDSICRYSSSGQKHRASTARVGKANRTRPASFGGAPRTQSGGRPNSRIPSQPALSQIGHRRFERLDSKARNPPSRNQTETDSIGPNADATHTISNLVPLPSFRPLSPFPDTPIPSRLSIAILTPPRFRVSTLPSCHHLLWSHSPPSPLPSHLHPLIFPSLVPLQFLLDGFLFLDSSATVYPRELGLSPIPFRHLQPHPKLSGEYQYTILPKPPSPVSFLCFLPSTWCNRVINLCVSMPRRRLPASSKHPISAFCLPLDASDSIAQEAVADPQPGCGR